MDFLTELLKIVGTAVITTVSTYIVLRKKLKHELSIFLEAEKNKFRLAAIDKKLQTAQEAYSYSLEFPRLALESAGIGEIKDEDEFARILDWWKNNSLYLSAEVRSEFHQCLKIVSFYGISHKLSRENTTKLDELKKKFERLENLPGLIKESVNFERTDHFEVQNRTKETL